MLWEKSRLRNHGQQAAREGLTARFTRATPLGAAAEALTTVDGTSGGMPKGGITINLRFDVKV